LGAAPALWQTPAAVNGRIRFPLALLGLLLAGALGACSRPAAWPAKRGSGTGPAALVPPGGGAAVPRTQLSQIRPPLPSCGNARTPARVLVSRSRSAYDRGDFTRGLACAEAALDVSPRLVPALSRRAAALVALNRAEEARVVYAQAMAIDPDDLDTLYGAADLYVLRLNGERPSLELGLEYALRGARLARHGPHHDRALAGDLLVLAAMASNDLGYSRDALARADEALKLGAVEADARYERGVALYELCRFREARAALERVLALEPDDAWAQHYLGLVAERTGDEARAETLERRARELAPDDFTAPVDVDRGAFEKEVRQAVASLPDEEKRALAHVPVEIADVPALADLVAVDPPLSPSILGLYRGPSERERCLPQDGPQCRSIVVYRRNLERFARDRAELEEQVKVTLLHELGHFHGESDEQLRARGLE
jgi:predicted Zn-dependent protease with MMP-like domain/Flp pilus assembly protein TadD